MTIDRLITYISLSAQYPTLPPACRNMILACQRITSGGKLVKILKSKSGLKTYD